MTSCRLTQADLFREARIIRQPIQLAYGMGWDSTAMLVGLRDLGIIPEKILFADTGAEKPGTYAYEPIIQEWLRKYGFPPIETVKYVARNFKNWPPYYTLEDNCLTNGTLPGISFGPASCSIKWKQSPQHKHLKQWSPAVEAWANGLPVIKLIGYDCSPADRRRTYNEPDTEASRYTFIKPLQDWGWDRRKCGEVIAADGLPVPPKSSCFFCLAMKPHEVLELGSDELRRIIRLEARAAPRLQTCEGLWRTTVKGTRGGTPRPGSMTRFIREQRLLDWDEIDLIWLNTPREIVTFQAGYAEALSTGRTTEYTTTHSAHDYRRVA